MLSLMSSCRQVGAIDFADPFPAADIILLGMILHDWGLPKKQLLIRKVPGRDRMRAGGRVGSRPRNSTGTIKGSLEGTKDGPCTRPIGWPCM